MSLNRLSLMAITWLPVRPSVRLSSVLPSMSLWRTMVKCFCIRFCVFINVWTPHTHTHKHKQQSVIHANDQLFYICCWFCCIIATLDYEILVFLWNLSKTNKPCITWRRDVLLFTQSHSNTYRYKCVWVYSMYTYVYVWIILWIVFS